MSFPGNGVYHYERLGRDNIIHCNCCARLCESLDEEEEEVT